MAPSKFTPFNTVAKVLSSYGIVWEKSRGKGSHGAFVGNDKDGNSQSFPLPRSQHKDVHKHYLKELCRRFQLDPNDAF